MANIPISGITVNGGDTYTFAASGGSNHWINVMEADPTIDNTGNSACNVNIKNIYSNMNAGDTLFIPAGTYLMAQTLSLNKHINIIGESSSGNGATVIKSNGGLAWNATASCRIEHLKFNNNITLNYGSYTINDLYIDNTLLTANRTARSTFNDVSGNSYEDTILSIINNPYDAVSSNFQTFTNCYGKIELIDVNYSYICNHRGGITYTINNNNTWVSTIINSINLTLIQNNNSSSDNLIANVFAVALTSPPEWVRGYDNNGNKVN